jgi:hypothetical protein
VTVHATSDALVGGCSSHGNGTATLQVKGTYTVLDTHR